MPMTERSPLPIDALTPDILAAWRDIPVLVIEAPPGAGKTTRLPLALLEAPERQNKILLLEPRRLAARAAAERLSRESGTEVGSRIGYQVRLERRISAETELEILTTGLFLRRLQAEPDLPGIGMVLFDEFHERTLEGDLALALLREARETLRPDLRIGLLSATFDGAALAQRIPGSRALRSEGRAFPIRTEHFPGPWRENLGRVTRHAFAGTSGDILIFLAGAREIRRAQEELSDLPASLHVLHGDMPLAQQSAAIQRDPNGRRKIILATAIAETSLTIDGVRIVIDSGERRAPLYDPSSGMTRLATRRVALAEADQRRGRAGRQAPGFCYRLWGEAEERGMARFAPPEIAQVDLAPLALELALWGGTPDLLTPPPPAHLASARTLLADLAAIDEASAITSHGRAMAELGTHPRLAHMMITAKERGLGALACDIAALLGERDPLRHPHADLRDRLDYLWGKPGSPLGRSAALFRRQLGVTSHVNARDDREQAGALLALAYPERIAQRTGQDYRMRYGGRATLAPDDPLGRGEFLAIGELDGARERTRIFSAAPLARADIEAGYAAAITVVRILAWNRSAQAIEAFERRMLGALVLAERRLDNLSPEQTIPVMLEGIRRMGFDVLPWDKKSTQLRARLGFLHARFPGWPDVSDAGLLGRLEEWLAPFLSGMRSRADLAALDLSATLLAPLSWDQRQALDRLAPSHIRVPSGALIAIDYDADEPRLAVRLQEMFGLAETPAIGEGTIPLVLELLSPAHRPIQRTQDLAGFWRGSYRAVRADMRGRYPRHTWPEDPLAAQPTTRKQPRS